MAYNVYTPEQVRELDRIAIEEQGIPGYELMNRAARAFFAAVTERYPEARRWLVLCGSGNNAGDGYFVARLARGAGYDVQLVALSDSASLTGDAATACNDYLAAGGTVQDWSGSIDAGAVDIAVDALLGTGIGRDVDGAYLDAVNALNGSSLPVLAVDIPSGLNGSSGEIMGASVRATLTVTFVAFKQGLFLGKGPDLAGETLLDDLDIADVADERVPPTLKIFSDALARRLLPKRKRSGHKGAYGHVLVIGGNDGMGGAVHLAGEAALRSGAGLVSVATRPANVQAINEARPELMCRGIETGDELDELLDRATVLAIGPGLGQDDWARDLYVSALAAGKPLVVDADALNLLAGEPCTRDDWVLTPHPGEAGRLTNSDSSAVQGDRLGTLQAINGKYGGTVLLKGHGTLVGSAGSPVPWLIRGGNPGMATAGMGDVLTGVTAAMLAQFAGESVDNYKDIVALAAWLHAAAGDRASVSGERGLIASDLFEELRACLNP